MAFINSQDPGPPKATVHICYSLKTMALRNYSNSKVQLHFHSLAPHLRLTQSYMASRITRKYPAETHLTSNLAFFFSSKSDLHITSSDATNSSGQWKNLQEGVFDMKLLLSCYMLGRRARMEHRKFFNALILLPLPEGRYFQVVWTGPSDHSYLNIWAELLPQQS